MTDKLIEQIKADREHDAIGGNDRRRSRVIEYEDRIKADAEVIKAAEELAEAVTHEREMVCQDVGMQLDAIQSVDDALAAFRQAQARAEKGEGTKDE